MHLTKSVICDKLFQRTGELYIHKERVHIKSGFKYECDICGKEFENEKYVSRHVKNVHHRNSRNLILECNFCEKKLASGIELRKHHFKHVEENKNIFFCGKCDKTFRSNRGLKLHLQTIHYKNWSGSCLICDKIFNSQIMLERHIKTWHEPKKRGLTCNLCAKIFMNKTKLSLHESIHSETILWYACDICEKTFSKRNYLKVHFRIAHVTNTRSSCELCFQEFKYKWYLERHMESNHQPKKYKCSHCLQLFGSSNSMKTHMKRKHDTSTQVQFECGLCKKLFAEKGNLKRHYRSIHKKIRHSCKICNKSYSDQTVLKNHVLTIHQGTNYGCDICEKTFNFPKSLKIHYSNEHTI